MAKVALPVSAWIEITTNKIVADTVSSRTPRECVD